MREEGWKSKEKLQEWGVVMGNVVFYNYNVVYMGIIGTGINMKAVDISSDGFKTGLQIIHYVWKLWDCCLYFLISVWLTNKELYFKVSIIQIGKRCVRKKKLNRYKDVSIIMLCNNIFIITYYNINNFWHYYLIKIISNWFYP